MRLGTDHVRSWSYQLESPRDICLVINVGLCIYLLDAPISKGFQLNFSRASPTIGTIYKVATDPVLNRMRIF